MMSFFQLGQEDSLKCFEHSILNHRIKHCWKWNEIFTDTFCLCKIRLVAEVMNGVLSMITFKEWYILLSENQPVKCSFRHQIWPVISKRKLKEAFFTLYLRNKKLKGKKMWGREMFTFTCLQRFYLGTLEVGM